MATQRVCLFYKYGYCKHKETCRKRHISEICDKTSCDILTCVSRHPKICKFYREYGKCKFDPCAFLHIDQNDTIDELKQKNEDILEQLKNLDDMIKVIDEKLTANDSLHLKLQQLENKLERFQSMEQTIYKKDCMIDDLNKKVNLIETNLEEKDKKIEELFGKFRLIEEKQDNLDLCRHNCQTSGNLMVTETIQLLCPTLQSY